MEIKEELSVQDIGQMFDDAIPVRNMQKFIFTQLLDSISASEKLGVSPWSISILRNGFRLNVGPVEAMTCMLTFWEAGQFGNANAVTFVDLRLLLAGEDCLGKIDAKEDECGRIDETHYKSVGEQNWCYQGGFNTEEPEPEIVTIAAQISKLRENHHAFIALACRTSTGKLRKKSNYAQHHCEALYQYALAISDPRR